MRRLSLIALLIGLAGPVSAQTAPSASEVAAYDGPLPGRARRAMSTRSNDWSRKALTSMPVTSRGRTPAHVAAFASEDEALRALAEAGADMNALEDRAYDVVTIAAVADDPELMSLAIELGNDPGLVTSPYLGTALIAAAHLGHAEVVRRLIEAGAPLDHINNLHWTAVMEAVVLGDGGPDHQAVLDALARPPGPTAHSPIAMASHRFSTPKRVGSRRWLNGFAEEIDPRAWKELPLILKGMRKPAQT